MNEFKRGDRVIYVGDDTPRFVGVHGEVVVDDYSRTTNIRVRFDTGQLYGVYPSNLQLEDENL